MSVSPNGRTARTALLVAAPLFFIGRFLGYAVPLIGSLLVGVLVAVTARLVAELAEPPPPDRRPGQSLADGVPNQAFARIVAIEDRLGWSVLSQRYVESTIRPWLLELAAERLQRLHGVDLARQPDRARELMGEDLWLMAKEAPITEGPGWPPARTAQLVSAIEAI